MPKSESHPYFDYSGPLDPNFSWDNLDKKTLAVMGREVMIMSQIHDNSVMPIIGAKWGSTFMTDIALDEWMGSSPIYNERVRALHHIDDDGVDVIMKGLQLDVGAPHMWLKFHFDVKNHDLGYFWLTFCGAYNHVHNMTAGDPSAATQICVHMEDPTFDATVMAVNPGARCKPIYRPPHDNAVIPEAGPCKWEVSIADRLGMVEVNDITGIVRQSSAGNFEFPSTPLTGDGLSRYNGEFKRDLILEDLDSGLLLDQFKEFALDIHLLQKACYLGIESRQGTEPLAEVIREEWAALAPVHHERLQKLFNIEGDSMSSILKLLQVNVFFVPNFVEFGVHLESETLGYFWIKPCAALQSMTDGSETNFAMLTPILQGKSDGLQQCVQSINPRAVVRAVDPETVKTHDQDAKVAFELTIDPSVTPAEPSSYTDLLRMSGVGEVDLTAHLYTYED